MLGIRIDTRGGYVLRCKGMNTSRIKVWLVVILACLGWQMVWSEAVGQEEQGGMKALEVQPDLKSKFFIYVSSADWCGWCKRITPMLVEEYPKMKERGVELIMFYDTATEEKARAFLRDSKINFPVVWVKKEQGNPGISGIMGNSVPSCLYMNPEGEVIARGHGVAVKDWAAICFPSSPKPNVKKMIKELKPLSKKISSTAKFYVYIWAFACGDEKECNLFLDELSEAYKDIRREHGELIFITTDLSPKFKEAYMNSKRPFPATEIRFLAGCGGLPGLMFGQDAVVDTKGRTLLNGNGGVIKNWQDAVRDAKEVIKDSKESKKGKSKVAG